MGIATVRDLAAADPGAMAEAVGPAIGPWLVRLARGEDHSPVTDAPYVPRSVGRETTFPEDLRDWEDVRRALDAFTDRRPVRLLGVRAQFAQ